MCLAVPGKVLEIRDQGPLDRWGKVDFGGVARDVNMSCVPEAMVGDYVIVHVGMALSRLDEEEAAKVFEYLKEIDELDIPGEVPA